MTHLFSRRILTLHKPAKPAALLLAALFSTALMSTSPAAAVRGAAAAAEDSRGPYVLAGRARISFKIKPTHFWSKPRGLARTFRRYLPFEI